MNRVRRHLAVAMIARVWGLLVAGCVLWLTGCATTLATQGPPVPIITTEKCVASADLPPQVPRLTQTSATDLQNTAAIDLERRRLRQYQDETAALLLKCSQ